MCGITRRRWLLRASPALFVVLVLGWLTLAGSAHALQGESGTVTIDSPAPGSTIANGEELSVAGWAVVPAGLGAGVERVEVYLDAEPGAGGLHVGSARSGIARPDVAAAFGRPDWTSSGFLLTWTLRNLEPGAHTLYVYAYFGGEPVAVSRLAIQVAPGYDRTCSFIFPCLLARDSLGWELDYGGPGTRFDYFTNEPGR